MLPYSPLPEPRIGGPPIDVPSFPGAITLPSIQGELELALSLDRWFALPVTHLSPPTGTAASSVPRQSPVQPTPPVAPTPAGAAGSAGISSSLLLLSGFAALLVMFSAAVPRFTRGLDAVSASWRPMPPVSLLERPG
jgi:hypothetical protein